jgi:bla regulator protein BlaR1
MEPSTINALISDHMMKALCNTLMHSLWQGIVLAAISGAIVIFTKKAKAAYRYNLLVSALALFALGVTVTFIMQLQKPADTGINTLTYVTAADAHGVHANTVYPTGKVPGAVTAPNVGTKQSDMFQTAVNYFNTHYAIIVLIWFLIICAKSIQMAVGLHGVFHLRRTKVFAVSKDWEERLLQLAEQLHIRQTIRLLESGIAKVPMVIGHLKPVILIPIGLINSLSADEVEAILVHELAHIRRRDYLVNLLQSFMEILFFFNPAVLWISQLIKTERENCCDDLAIAQSRNRENYIRALLSCEEYKAAGPNYAMAFPGSKNTLLARVKRMVGNRNHSLNIFEKTVLTICLVVLGLGVSAFTAREDIKKAIRSVVAVIHHDIKTGDKAKLKAGKNDTALKKQDASVNSTAALVAQLQKPALPGADTDKSAGASALKQLTDKIDSARGNTGTLQSQLATLAKMDTANFKKFHAIGQELYREHLVVDTNHLNISLNDQELIVNGVRMPELVFQRISGQFSNRGRYGDSYAQPYGNKYPGSNYANLPDVSKEIAWGLIKENLVKDKTYFTYRLSRDEFSIDGIKQPDELRRRIIDEFFKPDDDFNIGYTFKDPGIYGGSNSRYNKSSADYQRQSDAHKRYWAGQQRKIIDEMQREGLIINRKDLSFTLTTKTFVINGLVQSNEVFERYRQEYVPADAGDNWNWNYSVGGSEPTDAYRSRDWDAYSRQTAAERQRVEAERDKKLVADLLQDGLITDVNNVTFTLSDKKLEINGKKQSEELYNKYKDKYMPSDSGGDWSWTYSHHK